MQKCKRLTFHCVDHTLSFLLSWSCLGSERFLLDGHSHLLCLSAQNLHCSKAWGKELKRIKDSIPGFFLCKSQQFVRNTLWDGKFLGLLLLLGLPLPASSPLCSPLDRLGTISDIDHWDRTRLRLLLGCRQKTRSWTTVDTDTHFP